MATAILALQAFQTIELEVSEEILPPEFKMGDRLYALQSDDPADLDIQAGIVTGICLDETVWKYKLDPRNRPDVDQYNTCSYQEDYAWVSESELQILDDVAIVKLRRLLNMQPSDDERRASQLITTLYVFPSFLFDDRSLRKEWNQLMSKGFIPECLGYMEV